MLRIYHAVGGKEGKSGRVRSGRLGSPAVKAWATAMATWSEAALGRVSALSLPMGCSLLAAFLAIGCGSDASNGKDASPSAGSTTGGSATNGGSSGSAGSSQGGGGGAQGGS